MLDDCCPKKIKTAPIWTEPPGSPRGSFTGLTPMPMIELPPPASPTQLPMTPAMLTQYVATIAPRPDYSSHGSIEGLRNRKNKTKPIETEAAHSKPISTIQVSVKPRPVLVTRD